MNKSGILKQSASILLIFTTIHIAFAIFPAFFNPWSNQVMDQLALARLQLYGAEKVSPDIVHIDINDSSLKQIRPDISSLDLLELLITKLNQLNVSGIAIDIVFPRCSQADFCSSLTEVIASAGNVYLPIVLKPQYETSEAVLPPPIFKSSWNLRDNSLTNEGEMQVAFSNFDSLNEASAGLGHITGSPDGDGVFRRFPLLHQSRGRYIPSLTTKMLADFLAIKQNRIQWLDNHILHFPQAKFPDGRTLDIDIPLDAKGRILLNFPGLWNNSFYHYSAAHILQIKEGSATFDDLLDELEGTLVIVSDVTTGSRDFGPISLESNYPLSGIHATIANAILLQQFHQPASQTQESLVFIFLILGLVFGAFHFRVSGFTLFALAMLLFLISATFYTYVYGHIEFNLLRNALSILAASAWVNGQKYFTQEKEKAIMHSRFEQYLAPEVLNKVLQSPSQLNNRDRKFLTILFSDIVGFTTWCSDKSPEIVHQALSQYFESMAEIVFHYGGTVDKYMGDGLLVFFGDPLETPNHPELAVHAAQEMQRVARVLRKQWVANHGLPLEVRIGINSGEVIVGNIGSRKRFDYTVIGANVNLAQRLESHAPPGGILISSAVAVELKSDISLTSARKIQVKGFKKPITVFQVLPDSYT